MQRQLLTYCLNCNEYTTQDRCTICNTEKPAGVPGPTYRYRLTNTGHSSARFGPCEVCGLHVSEVYIQIEQREFESGWTGYECFSYFGHEACLRGKQRKPEMEAVK